MCASFACWFETTQRSRLTFARWFCVHDEVDCMCDNAHDEKDDSAVGESHSGMSIEQNTTLWSEDMGNV